MSEPARRLFHQELELIEQKVSYVYALVVQMVSGASSALLGDDTEVSKAVCELDQQIDDLYVEIEQLCERALVLQAPVAGEARFVIAVLRIVPELERSGDLAEHIASRAGMGLVNQLNPRAKRMVEQMGELDAELWRRAADAWTERDSHTPDELDTLDDQVDDLQIALVDALQDGDVPHNVAIEMALIARFFERLGDHAVHITRRVGSLG